MHDSVVTLRITSHPLKNVMLLKLFDNSKIRSGRKPHFQSSQSQTPSYSIPWKKKAWHEQTKNKVNIQVLERYKSTKFLHHSIRKSLVRRLRLRQRLRWQMNKKSPMKYNESKNLQDAKTKGLNRNLSSEYEYSFSSTYLSEKRKISEVWHVNLIHNSSSQNKNKNSKISKQINKTRKTQTVAEALISFQ